MKIDPYKNKEIYEHWKAKGSPIEDISKINANYIRKFIYDLEAGTNVCISNKKGARSFVRLNSYKSKLKVLFISAEKRFNRTDITKLKKEEFNLLCKDLREGKIKRQDGKPYLDAGDYVKSFKSFWHWLQKVNSKLEDITLEADISRDKPKWVYLDEKQFKKLADSCKPFYKILAYFELDTGLRATECINTRVSDFEDDFKIINVRDEVSKTVGRKFKLMICGDLIKEYVADNKLKDDDLLFYLALGQINKYFKRKAKALFGDKKSKAGANYSDFTIGDIRHISACYWLPRYPTQQGMMYRFGWKKSDKIFYYSEFLGMNDNITQEHMLLDVTKTELQQQVESLKKDEQLKTESFTKEIEKLKKDSSEENIKKMIFEIAGKYFEEKEDLKNYVHVFGSTMKQKPEHKKN
jgi:integrase